MIASIQIYHMVRGNDTSKVHVILLCQPEALREMAHCHCLGQGDARPELHALRVDLLSMAFHCTLAQTSTLGPEH